MRRPTRSWLSALLAGLLMTGVVVGLPASAQAVTVSPSTGVTPGSTVTFDVRYPAIYLSAGPNCSGDDLGSVPGNEKGSDGKSWVVRTTSADEDGVQRPVRSFTAFYDGDSKCINVAYPSFTSPVVASISGEIKTGTQLTASAGAYAPTSGTTLAYAWTVSGLVRSTQSTYTPPVNLAGQSLTLTVTASNPAYQDSTSSTVPTAIALGEFSTFTTQIIGSGKPGEKLSTTAPTGLTPTPASYAYSWQVNDQRSPVSTTDEYTPKLADQGKKIILTVTAKGAGGVPADKSAKVEKDVVAGSGISGDLKVASKLSFAEEASLLASDDAECADGSSIATVSAEQGYTLKPADAGRYLQLVAGEAKGTCVGPVAKGTFDGVKHAEYTGDLKVAETVTAVDPTEVPDGTTITHAWKVGDETVSTDDEYTVEAKYAGQDLHLETSLQATGYEDKVVTTKAIEVAKGTLADPGLVINDSTPDTAPTTGDTLSVDAPEIATLSANPEDATSTWSWGHLQTIGVARGGSECVTDGTFGTSDYTVTNADAGQTICARILTQAEGYEDLDTSAEAADTALGTFTAPTVTFDHEPQVGVVSKPVVTGLDPEGTPTYSWKVGDVEVSTDEGYEPTPDDLGKSITVTVTNTKDDFVDDVSSTEAATVKKGVFTIRQARITGTPKVGQTLTHSNLRAPRKPANVTYTYQWGAQLAGDPDCLAIGATTSTLTLPRTSKGSRICVIATAKAPGYKDAVSVSDLTDVVDGLDMTVWTPTISDTTPEIGDTLYANVSREGYPQDSRVSFFWGTKVLDEDGVARCELFRDETNGYGSSSYKVKVADGGSQLCVTVKVTAEGYNDGQATSRFTSVVTKRSMGTVGVTISDTTPTFGDSITASTTGTGIPSGATKSFHWGTKQIREGSGGPGTAYCDTTDGPTTATIDVPADVVDQQLCVTVTVTAEGYEDANATSAFTDAVEKKSLGTVTVSIDDTTPTFGDTLTASVAGSGLPEEHNAKYRWGVLVDDEVTKTCDTSREIGYGPTLEVGTDLVGYELCAVANVGARGYESQEVTSAFTSPVAKATLTLGTPVVSDTTPTFGDELTATVGGAPDGASTSWTWGTFDVLSGECVLPSIVQKNLVLVDGSAHTVTAGEVGTKLCVVATVSADGYETATSTSDATETVVGKAFSSSPTVTLAATPQVAVEVEALVSGGSPDEDETSKTFQWSVGGTEVEGATASTFTPSAADAGKDLTVTVVSSADGYLDDTSSSDPVEIAKGTFQAPGPSVDNDSPKVGETLTASVDLTGMPDGASVAYQWGIDDDKSCAPIDGATGSTYDVSVADLDTFLCVKTTVSAEGYEDSTTMLFVGNAVVKGAFLAPQVTIDDTTPVVGQTLTASVDLSGLDLVSTPTVTYHWGTSPNGGACSLNLGQDSSQVVGEGLVGKEICVLATVSAEGYVSDGTIGFTEPAGKGSTTIGAPVVSSSAPKVGVPLTASGPTVPAGGSVSYFWGTAAVGSTTCTTATTAASSYTPKVADLGKNVCVVARSTGMDAYTDTTSDAVFTTRVREAAGVTLNDDTIKKGQKFTISGFDLVPGKKYTIEVYDTKLTGTAGANGRISRTYTYPAAASSKTRKITVSQVEGGKTLFRKAVYLTYTR